jgi:hypothetical protein
VSRAIRVLVGTMAALAVIPAAARAVTLSGPPGQVTATAAISPSALPTQGAAPLALSVDGRIAGTETVEVNGAKLPVVYATNTLDLLLDRRLSLTTEGLPTCTNATLDPARNNKVTPAQARKRCGDALIGSGSFTQEFLEQAPGSFVEPTLLFNAPPKNGQPRFLTFVYLPPDTPIYGGRGGASTGTVTRPSGQTDVQIRFPDPSDGGHSTAFHFRFGRRWVDGAARRSLLAGTCPGRELSVGVTLRYYQVGQQATGTVPTACIRGAA